MTAHVWDPWAPCHLPTGNTAVPSRRLTRALASPPVPGQPARPVRVQHPAGNSNQGGLPSPAEPRARVFSALVSPQWTKAQATPTRMNHRILLCHPRDPTGERLARCLLLTGVRPPAEPRGGQRSVRVQQTQAAVAPPLALAPPPKLNYSLCPALQDPPTAFSRPLYSAPPARPAYNPLPRP